MLCRSLDQLAALLHLGVQDVTADFADIRQYAAAAELSRDAGARLYLATPRIHKPGETGIFHALARHGAAGILARNLAAIEFFRTRETSVLADYSLNVANELTAAVVMQLGVDRLTASYDLNRNQLLSLMHQVPPAWLEVVVHQHMPMFHMEHCVYCAVLSPGTNKTNCGRPCDLHQVQLEDRVGMKHRLAADVGCRNTLYNAQPQSAAEIVPSLMEAGVRWFRIELLDETTTDQVRRLVQLYQQLLRGEVRGAAVWSQLQAANRVGVTRGTMEASRDPLAIL